LPHHSKKRLLHSPLGLRLLCCQATAYTTTAVMCMRDVLACPVTDMNSREVFALSLIGPPTRCR
jgi:hypothetical protein